MAITSPKRCPGNGDDVGIVEEAIQSTGSEQGIAEQGWPFIQCVVGGDDGGARFIATSDDIVEHFGIGVAERLETKIVQHQHRQAHQAFEFTRIGALEFGESQTRQHRGGVDIHGIVTLEAGLMS